MLIDRLDCSLRKMDLPAEVERKGGNFGVYVPSHRLKSFQDFQGVGRSSKFKPCDF